MYPQFSDVTTFLVGPSILHVPVLFGYLCAAMQCAQVGSSGPAYCMEVKRKKVGFFQLLDNAWHPALILVPT